jgi:hypothetical protein
LCHRAVFQTGLRRAILRPHPGVNIGELARHCGVF